MMHPRARPLVMTALIAAGAVTMATVLVKSFAFFTFFELKGLDLLFALRGPERPPPQVVVVAIDEPSFAEIGLQWPWPRGLHARLLDNLREAGARAVGFDILFAEPSAADEDQRFADSLALAGNAVLVANLAVVDDPQFRQTRYIDPIPELAGVAASGVPILTADADGTVRRAPLTVDGRPTFAARLAAVYRGERGHRPAEAAGVPGQNRLIDFVGPPRTLRTVSYYQALDYKSLLSPGVFADKVVLVGRSVESSPEPRGMASDSFLTPYSWVSRSATAGVEIQANLVADLLAGRSIVELATWQQLLFLLLLVVPASLPFTRLRPLMALGSAALLALGVVGLAWLAFVALRLWLPVFSAVLALSLSYVAHLVVRTLVAERERLRLLEEHNQELEQEVARQTWALTAANADLLDQQQTLQRRHEDLQQTHQALIEAQGQLVQSEKMAALGCLVAGVAHEINNPIGIVHGNLDFIEDYTGHLVEMVRAYAEPASAEEGRRRGEQQREALNFAQTSTRLEGLIRRSREGTNRVRKIVLDLQAFARTDDFGMMETDLQAGLEAALGLVASPYQERIRTHRDYAWLPPVLCQPDQINQVFMNVLQNAFQAIPGEGNVWVATRVREDRALVTVRDDGVGIASDLVGRVFDPFYTTRPVGSGTGLGLSISRRIMLDHGGMITVASRAAEGTEFTIELPLRTQYTR